MAEVKLMVLYPHPTDVGQFDRDYQDHLKLVHEKAQIPQHEQPYTVTRFVETPQGRPMYYTMFTMPFPSAQALQQAMRTPEMQEIASDAVRISSGGARSSWSAPKSSKQYGRPLQQKAADHIVQVVTLVPVRREVAFGSAGHE